MFHSMSFTKTVTPSDYEHPPQTSSETPSNTLQAWETLVESHIPLVREIAARVSRTLPPWVDLESLIQSGVVGLLDAARRYDAKRGVQFRTYAGYRIRGEIIEYLRSLDLGSRGVRAWGRELAEAHKRCLIRYGREGSPEELSTELGVPLERYYQLDQRVHNAAVLSLEEASFTDDMESGARQEPSLPGAILDPATAVEGKDLIEKLTAAIEQLPPRERLVVTLYYHEELTLREIGEVLHLTEGRISQILSKTVEQLRQALMNNKSSRIAYWKQPTDERRLAL
ncbi:MAG: FliA/WhiG family RNA polymerase sigma factor [Candidatus Binatia bacterium]